MFLPLIIIQEISKIIDIYLRIINNSFFITFIYFIGKQYILRQGEHRFGRSPKRFVSTGQRVEPK